MYDARRVWAVWARKAVRLSTPQAPCHRLGLRRGQTSWIRRPAPWGPLRPCTGTTRTKAVMSSLTYPVWRTLQLRNRAQSARRCKLRPFPRTSTSVPRYRRRSLGAACRCRSTSAPAPPPTAPRRGRGRLARRPGARRAGASAPRSARRAACACVWRPRAATWHQAARCRPREGPPAAWRKKGGKSLSSWARPHAGSEGGGERPRSGGAPAHVRLAWATRG